jgi:thioester reductase-like protein
VSYFVTGATGFIGRHLVENLLANREGDINVLVREGSVDKLDALMPKWSEHGDTSRIKPVFGDLAEPALGVDAEVKAALKGSVDHFFHLAAIYDMTADEERNMLLNVEGTQNAIDLANELEAGTVHHVSSIAAAGLYKGHFTEDMFDEGQTRSTAPTTSSRRSRRSGTRCRSGCR